MIVAQLVAQEGKNKESSTVMMSSVNDTSAPLP